MIFLTVGLMPLNSHAEADQKELMKKALALSGMIPIIKEVRPAMLQALADESAGVSPAIYDVLYSAIVKEYEPDKITNMVYANMDGKLSVETLKNVLTWLSSSLGKKISMIEVAGSSPDAPNAILRYAQTGLKTNPPSERRQSLVEKIDSLLSATDQTVKVAMSVPLGISIAIDTTRPKDQQIGRDILENLNNSRYTMYYNIIKPYVRNSLLYTYRRLNDDELSQYVKFISSKDGLSFCVNAYRAFTGTIQTLNKDFSDRAVQLLKGLQKNATGA